MLVFISPCSSIHGSAGNSPYRHPVSSPRSTHSNGAITSHNSDTSNGSIPLIANGDSTVTSPDHNGAVADCINGSFHVTEEETDEADDMGRCLMVLAGDWLVMWVGV